MSDIVKYANKIAKVLKVNADDVLTDGVISISKIADILESRGEYSYLDDVCLAECLHKHYKKVNHLLDAYWRFQ